MYDVKQCIIVSLSPLKTLEEEFARKLQEQEWDELLHVENYK